MGGKKIPTRFSPPLVDMRGPPPVESPEDPKYYVTATEAKELIEDRRRRPICRMRWGTAQKKARFMRAYREHGGQMRPACKEAEIEHRMFYSWLRDPRFYNALILAKRDLSEKAYSKLSELMESDDPNVAYKAAARIAEAMIPEFKRETKVAVQQNFVQLSPSEIRSIISSDPFKPRLVEE